jgi:amidophosphoribosyltransferase
MARDVGANKVYFASAAPPVRYPNVYGIDMPAVNEFIADGRSIEEINKKIGSDRLFYQTLEDLVESILMDTGIEMEFDSSCFDGKYVTGNITEDYLKKLFDKRNDNAKQEDSDEDQGLDLHNDSA